MLKVVDTRLKHVRIEEGQSQYDLGEIRKNMIVPAVYIYVKNSENDPNIAALPPLISQHEFLSMYGDQKTIVNVNEVNRMTPLEMLDAVCTQSCSVPLWYYYEVTKCIRSLLLKSYSSRTLYTRASPVDDDELEAYIRREGDRPEFGMLIGPSGCGKTHLVESISRMYPSVIRHDLPEITYHQIPILLVTTVVQSLGGLLDVIAERLDELLDQGSFHKNRMERKRSIGHKIPLLEEWIKRYAIGLIIIDEAQFLDFGGKIKTDSASQRSVENLITVTENTGIPILFVGNPELDEKIAGFGRMRTRIAGNRIDVDRMSDMGRDMFLFEIRVLWGQTYIKNRPTLTDEMVERLADACAYNMCILTAILKELQYKSAMGSRISEDVIMEVCNEKDIEDMRSCLRVGGEEADKKMKDSRDKINKKISDEKKRLEKQDEEYSLSVYMAQKERENADRIKKEALEAVRISRNVPLPEIETAFRVVYKDDPLRVGSLSVEEVAGAVMETLDELNRKASKKASHGRRNVNRPPASDAEKAVIADIVNAPLQIGSGEPE